MLILSLHIFKTQGQEKYFGGFNGHPLTQGAYGKNYDAQFGLLSDLNAKAYRIDLPMDTSGRVLKEKQLGELIGLSKKYNIQLLPVLIFPFKIEIFELGQPYERGFRFGKTFAIAYGSNFEVVEVGNEQDNKLMLGNRLSGRSVKHYQIGKAEKMIKFMKGVVDGLKGVRPQMRLIVDFNYVHFGFLDLLEEHEVRYDIIGLHWYSNMGDLYSFGTEKLNVLAYLKKYHRDIWITEFNVFPSARNIGGSGRKWTERNLMAIKKSGNVKALFVYELFDQPELKSISNSEANFGVVRWIQRYDKFERKEEYDVYKNHFIGEK